MIKVADKVLEIVQSDELAIEALRAGVLNFSAYADRILPQVENATKKPVQRGTVVVALSRIARDSKLLTAPIKPEIKINNLEIKSPLFSVTYPKTVDIQRKLAVLTPFQISANDLLAVSEGPTEITLVCSHRCKPQITTHFATDPIKSSDELTAINLQFSKEFLEKPNFYFALFSTLAVKRIKIVEVLTTATELVLIIEKSDMEETLKALNGYFVK